MTEAPVLRHLEAGIRYASRGQARPAEREWREAVRLNPREARAWEALGELYASTENWAAGAVAFRTLLRLRPNEPHVHSRLAACLFRSGDEKGAFRQAQLELSGDPTDETALILSALLVSEMGKPDEEVRYLERLRRRAPKDILVLTLLAENLTFTHRYAEARPVLTQLIALAPDDVEAWALRGLGYMESDPSPEGGQKAEHDLVRALSIDPLAPFPRLYLGKLYRRRGAFDRAILQLETARRLAPNKRDIYYELATVYTLDGQTALAAQARAEFVRLRRLADLESSLKKKCAVAPEDFESHLRLGLLGLQEGDYHLARAGLIRAGQLRPADPRVISALHSLDTVANNIEDRQRALRLRPGTFPRGANPMVSELAGK